MPARPLFDITVDLTPTGDEIRVTRRGEIDFLLAARINKRLALYGASLVLDTARGWYLRSGEHRSDIDPNRNRDATLVLRRRTATHAA